MNIRTMVRLGLPVLALLAVLAGCDAPLVSPTAEIAPEEPAPPIVLPPDQLNDVARDADFDFETYVPVDLALLVSPVLPDRAIGSRSVMGPTFVTITDDEGNLVYRGSVDADGTVTGTFGVPTSEGPLTLIVEGPQIEDRSMVIDDPASLVRIDRRIFVAPLMDASGSRALAVSDGGDGITDSDGDTVPDVYDAAPDDSSIAFATSFPADGSFTVAFEDNFPKLGDGDYNDFVVSYSVQVFASASPQGERISFVTGQATARARAAGYDHEFGIMLRMPGFSGSITSFYEDPTGATAPVTVQEETVGDEVRVRLFPYTKQAFARPGTRVTADNGYPDRVDSIGFRANFVIVPDAGSSALRADLAGAPFDPYLFIRNTGYDVHLIGREPLPGSNNPAGTEGFRDENDFPRALLVPADFAHPIETRSILNAYPRFGAWVDSLGATDTDWYVDPNPDLVVFVP